MAVWKKKNDGYVDLSERMRSRQEKIASLKEEMETEEKTEQKKDSGSGGFFSFFGGNNSDETTTPTIEPTGEVLGGEKRRKLAQRLLDMTNRIEDLENQIYGLKNKIEVLEKKDRVGY